MTYFIICGHLPFLGHLSFQGLKIVVPERIFTFRIVTVKTR